MRLILIIVLAVLLAGITYWWLERVGRRAWPAFVCRAVAWGALLALLANLSCPVRPTEPAERLVLLDASLSMGAAGGRWAEALDSASRWGEMRRFGDAGAPRNAADTVPTLGRSLLGPALTAALATGREVLVVTDGEIEDLTDLAPAALTQPGVRLFPRQPVRDLAMTEVTGPSRVTAGDSLTLGAEIRLAGSTDGDTVSLTVSLGERVLARRAVRLTGDGLSRVAIQLPTGSLPAGDQFLRVAIADANDAEPRDDARLKLVTVTATPGLVLLASPADWDSRFLYRTIREVADLPVRGYVQLQEDRWRTMDRLAPVGRDEVRQAVRHADVLIIKGSAPALSNESRARGVWSWPSGEGGETLLRGDWYLSVGTASPVAGAFLGLPVDSFPPAVQITPIEPGRNAWVALFAQEGRRGGERPVMIGHDSAGRRQILMAADGLWRWAFRGGASEQAYRALVASSVTWLLGGVDTAIGRARPIRPVVANARPVVFERIGGAAPAALPISLEGSGGTRRDTLRFDGAGHAELWLPVGTYRYRLEGGGGGSIAVEEFSEEWLPRPVGLTEQPSVPPGAAAHASVRQWIWLFALCIAGLAGEWWTRRRLGLR